MNTSNSPRNATTHTAAFGATLLAVVCALSVITDARAATRNAMPDRFTATTTAMTPHDVGLRIDVLEWSDDAARAAVVAALGDANPAKALAALPSLGSVWQSNSGVGYALKYAHRTSTAQGERLTFVTDKKVGAYELKPWIADATPAQPALGYSVIELYLDGAGHGAGTMSLAAEVKVDAAAALVSLADGAPRVLASAAPESKPR